MRAAVLLLGVVALALAAVLGRYEIVASAKSDEAVVVRLDRWTGQALLCGFEACVVLNTSGAIEP